MNYLQLCQKVTDLSGITQLRNQPISTANQVGNLDKIVGFVAKSWMDIQSMHPDWKFLWSESGELSMVAGQQDYPISEEVNVINGGLMIERDGSFSRISAVSFKQFREIYTGSQSGLPSVSTLTPQDNISFYPVPDSNYKYKFDYYSNSKPLTVDDDTPALHSKYQDAIVYLALNYLGAYLKDGDLMSIGKSEYDKQITRMANELLPNVTNHEPLA